MVYFLHMYKKKCLSHTTHLHLQPTSLPTIAIRSNHLGNHISHTTLAIASVVNIRFTPLLVGNTDASHTYKPSQFHVSPFSSTTLTSFDAPILHVQYPMNEKARLMSKQSSLYCTEPWQKISNETRQDALRSWHRNATK